jgi:signal transduction histidine kinase
VVVTTITTWDPANGPRRGGRAAGREVKAVVAEEGAVVSAEDVRRILELGPDEFFDSLVQLVARLFDVPIAHVSLLDSDTLWFKAKVGIDGDPIPRHETFCHWAVDGEDVLVVPDALLDDRFAANPRVVGDPQIRFYAGHPIRLPDGRAIGTLCVVDRTPRDLSDAQLGLLRLLATQAEWELSVRIAAGGTRPTGEPDAFLATATHDLRNPITAILGLAWMLEHDADRLAPEERTAVASAITRQARHLDRLVDDLLTIGVLAAGHRVEPEVVDVAAAVDTIVADSAFTIPVEVAVPAGVEALVDPGRLRQMVVNLVANAGRHGASRATVTGAVRGDWVELRIVDDGPGVAPELVPRLFERFATSGATTAAGERSTGLGLSIVRALARAHGGDAWYEPLPDGSCFALRLPQAGGTAAGEPAPAAAPDGRLESRPGALAAIRRLSSAARRHGRTLSVLTMEIRSPAVATTPDAVGVVARVAADHARLEDLLFQWDAARLVLVLPETDAEGAGEMVRRLTAALERARLATAEEPVAVDVGVQSRSFAGPAPEEVVAELEALLGD